jgi:hypothetical protein
MLLRRQIRRIAEPRFPFDGDDRRLLVIVGGRSGVMRRRNNPKSGSWMIACVAESAEQ